MTEMVLLGLVWVGQLSVWKQELFLHVYFYIYPINDVKEMVLGLGM